MTVDCAGYRAGNNRRDRRNRDDGARRRCGTDAWRNGPRRTLTKAMRRDRDRRHGAVGVTRRGAVTETVSFGRNQCARRGRTTPAPDLKSGRCRRSRTRAGTRRSARRSGDIPIPGCDGKIDAASGRRKSPTVAPCRDCDRNARSRHRRSDRKPIAYDIEEADRIVEAGERKGACPVGGIWRVSTGDSAVERETRHGPALLRNTPAERFPVRSLDSDVVLD